MSQYHFCRLFKQTKGLNPWQYVMQQRIQAAKRLLGMPQLSFMESSDVIVHAMMDFKDPKGADLKLFEMLRNVADASPRKRLFIYTTGCSIYGKRPERLMDETTPANPDHALAFRIELATWQRLMCAWQKVDLPLMARCFALRMSSVPSAWKSCDRACRQQATTAKSSLLHPNRMM